MGLGRGGAGAEAEGCWCVHGAVLGLVWGLEGAEPGRPVCWPGGDLGLPPKRFVPLLCWRSRSAAWCWEQTDGPAAGELGELEERQVLGGPSGLCRVGG